MLQLTVSVKRLNKRKVIPAVLPDPRNIAGEVFLGHSFEAEEVTNVPNPSLGKWYVDRDGYFYWEGGVVQQAASPVTTTPPPAAAKIVSYQNFIGFLNNAWLKGNGKNAGIIVIDNGVSASAMKFNIPLIKETDLTNGSLRDRDHGTFIAGIVCGRGGEIEGLANDASLLAIRYKDDLTSLDILLDNMNTALGKALELKQQNPQLKLVVNLSQGLRKSQADLFPDKIQKITGKIQSLTEAGILVCCAAGEDSTLQDGRLLFPALLPEVISVGCISPGYRNQPVSSQVDFITPIQVYESYDTANKIISDSGSSFSVAFISSIALLLHSVMTLQSKTHFKNLLSPYQKKMETFRFSDSEYEFFINK